MSDPYTRALSALEALFSPDLDPVAVGVWQEAREAIWEAQGQHAALAKELRALKEIVAPETASDGSMNVFKAVESDAKEPNTDSAALLETLHLLPDEPLPIRGE
jgi:hypothetical protein